MRPRDALSAPSPKRGDGSPVALLEELASDAVIDQAYAWLCERRKDFPHNAEVWDFRFRWREEKPRLQAALLCGDYRFEPLYRIRLKVDGDVDVWRARDQLVLKALQLVLARQLPASPRCTHLKGHGGAKWSVRAVREHLPRHAWVCRTDVKDYYASIDHERLLADFVRAIPDRRLDHLLRQYLRRVSERGGLFWSFTRGIALGCPLSPLMGAFFLHSLDRRMQALPVFYVRFMGDVLLLARTRWKLRRAVALLNATLDERGLEKHPGKTTIGRIARGFDFLGYHFSPGRLTLARQTLLNFGCRLTRLYEQERRSPRCEASLRVYGRRFASWAGGGLGDADFAQACRRLVALSLPMLASEASATHTSSSVDGSGTCPT